MTDLKQTARPYRLAVTGDQVRPDGVSIFGDIGLDRLAEHDIEWEVVPVSDRSLVSGSLTGFDALLMMGGASLTRDDLVGTKLRHVARFGAGYDAIDVPACTDAGVVVTNTPDALRVPMAHAALTMLFALAHNLVPKDRLVRTGRWDDRTDWHGRGLEDVTVGVIGLGGVGAETSKLIRAIGVDVVAYNRSPRPEVAEKLGITQLPLEDVAERSDYLIVAVAGGAGTTNLIDGALLDRMRPGSFLINISRGSVIDEEAVAMRLATGQLRGAALDVFREEPLPTAHAFATSERTIVAPHSLGWTEAFAANVASDSLQAIVDVATGREPANCVNRDAWSRRTPAR